MRALAFALGAMLLIGGCTAHRDRGGSPIGHAQSFPSPPTVSCPHPVIPAGRYAVTIPASKVPVEVQSFSAGHWTWTVDGVPDFHCFYRTYLSHTSDGQVNDIEIPVYTVAASNRIVIHWCCSIPDGTYEVSIQGDVVRLKTLHDDETEFEAVLSTMPWTRESGAIP